MTTVHPEALKRRSMLYRKLLEEGACFERTDDGAAPASYANANEVACARKMGIADLSTLPRIGFKGKDTPTWLVQHGVELPSVPNQACLQQDATLVVRLSNDEHLLLNDVESSGGLVARLASLWTFESDRLCYKLLREHSHCWLLLVGEHASTMLAKVCGVDMQHNQFPFGCVAQTSVARNNAIVVRSDLGTTPAFHLLADSASAEYLWFCLLDAMQEFAGGAVGLEALRALARGSNSR